MHTKTGHVSEIREKKHIIRDKITLVWTKTQNEALLIGSEQPHNSIITQISAIFTDGTAMMPSLTACTQ